MIIDHSAEPITGDHMKPNPEVEILNEKNVLSELSFRILLVEDNPGDVAILKELLKSSRINFKLTHTSTLKEALLHIIEPAFDVILLDLGLPDSIGLETLKKFQVFRVNSPVIVMTGLNDEDIALASLREGAQDYLVKNTLTPENILRSIRYSIERKKIHDLQRKYTRQFSVLSSATTAINETEDISSVYATICEQISKLIDNSGVVAIEIKNSIALRVSGTEWLKPWFEQIKLLTGIDMHESVFHISYQNKKILDLFYDGKIHEIKGGIHEILADNIDQKVCSELEKTIGIKNIYAIGIIRSYNFYGGVLIGCNKMIGDDDINIIEAVSNQASLNIYRRSVEKNLKLSETRYRKLSQELERKVKERTHDLEETNSLLNQELYDRKLAQEALKMNEAQLKELIATKDKFFNIVAHDLKNPFTSLLGSTELLFENIDRLDIKEIRKLAEILNDSAKGGYAILQNLLDWSRSQTGLLRFNPEKINLKELIDENISNLKLNASNKEINMYSEADEDIYIFADKNMLNTILRNLLNNALKFTHRGGKVNISVTVKRNEIILSVKDNGIGISEDNIQKLFRIDTKHQLPGTDKEQGTGLGLKLSKEFIEKQGGKIWVESVENKGSEFKFSIPVKELR